MVLAPDHLTVIRPSTRRGRQLLYGRHPNQATDLVQGRLEHPAKQISEEEEEAHVIGPAQLHTFLLEDVTGLGSWLDGRSPLYLNTAADMVRTRDFRT
ncbi:hypothetical protein FRC15_006512 [Serendipita sp. 397]|nr:hypothetical protein FRC15_006512 [Serendipita sp. 397]